MAIAHSPFEVLFNDTIRRNSKDPVARDLGIAKIAFGTMVVGSIASLFETTGRKPTDPRSLSVWNAQSKPEYSVKIGDKWVSMRSLGQFEILFKMTADFKEIYSELQDSPSELFHADGLTGAMAATAVNMFTPHFMQVGLGDLLEAANNNDQGILEAWPTTLMAQVTVPWSSLVKQTTTQIKGDYDVHGIKGDATGFYGMWEQYLNKVRATIGATGGMSHIRNVFGEVIQRPSGTGAGFVNPFMTSKVDNSPLANEIVKLFPEYAEIKRPQGGLAPLDAMAGIDRPSRTIKSGEVGGTSVYIKLNAQEWDILQAYTGNLETSDKMNKKYVSWLKSMMPREVRLFLQETGEDRINLRQALGILINTKMYETAGLAGLKKDATLEQKAYAQKFARRSQIQNMIQMSQDFGRGVFLTENIEQLRERVDMQEAQLKKQLGVK
jgi:hypothetical protein